LTLHLLINANDGVPRRSLVKKLIIAALAASTLATPVMAAPYQHQNNDHRSRVEQRFDNHHDRRQNQYRRWNRGERFDYRQARNYRVIANARQYHLRDAPRGYRWVQSGNDAVLIGITSGIVASVLANVLH
jgi:Ni/Co efflux regulator RcnB